MKCLSFSMVFWKMEHQITEIVLTVEGLSSVWLVNTESPHLDIQNEMANMAIPQYNTCDMKWISNQYWIEIN